MERRRIPSGFAHCQEDPARQDEVRLRNRRVGPSGRLEVPARAAGLVLQAGRASSAAGWIAGWSDIDHFLASHQRKLARRALACGMFSQPERNSSSLLATSPAGLYWTEPSDRWPT